VPAVFWFDRRLRVWFSPQPKPAPLAIVISGAGSDGNTSKLALLRGALYGAGYHVLTMPSPTFPGFIVAASSTGVAGDLRQDSRDLYAAMQQIVAHLRTAFRSPISTCWATALAARTPPWSSRSMRSRAS
jgi:hypothetical protein